MGLAGRLEALKGVNTRPNKCETCAFMETIGDEDRQAIGAAVAAGVQKSDVYKECVADGLAVSYRSFLTHIASPRCLQCWHPELLNA